MLLITKLSPRTIEKSKDEKILYQYHLESFRSNYDSDTYNNVLNTN